MCYNEHMKKVFIVFLVLLTVSGLLTGCTEEEKEDNMRFKEEYESLNGQVSDSDKAYRVIEIPENNPFVYTTCEELVERINNGETFIVYFGANWCPWCRSTLPYFVEGCLNLNIKKVYYVDVRKDYKLKNEIRDVYSYDDNDKIYLSHEGTKGYHDFCALCDSILEEYNSNGVTLDGTEFEGAKRIDAPSFIMIVDGKPFKLIDGLSSRQYDPDMELNSLIIRDMRSEIEYFLVDYLEAQE